MPTSENFSASQKGFGFIHLIIILTVLILAAVVGGSVYFGKKVSLELGTTVSKPIEAPDTEITYAKSVNLIADQFTKEDITKAKNLGANMITIWPTRILINNQIIFPYPERLAPFINFAHQNNLQVELRSSVLIPNLAKDYEKFRVSAIAHMVEYAKLGQKYKVYRIVPFGEIDNDLRGSCDKITELAQELLSEARKHYSGKIGTGVMSPRGDCGFKLTGYDYLTVSVYAHEDIADVINWARKVADRSNIQTLHIGETGTSNPGDSGAPDNFQTTVLDKEEEAKFYQDFFEKFSDKVDGVSVFYNSRINTMSINGDPAEEVVREWYGKL